jgi:hypothetical protein
MHARIAEHRTHLDTTRREPHEARHSGQIREIDALEP